jgi:hypothetical protein
LSSRRFTAIPEIRGIINSPHTEKRFQSLPRLQLAEKLGFVSGYRFSDTVSALQSPAPLGAAPMIDQGLLTLDSPMT